MLSFCDLAGSERISKTQNVGKRYSTEDARGFPIKTPVLKDRKNLNDLQNDNKKGEIMWNTEC